MRIGNMSGASQVDGMPAIGPGAPARAQTSRPSRADYDSGRGLVKGEGPHAGAARRATCTPPTHRRARRQAGTSGTDVEHRGTVVPTNLAGSSCGERRRASETRRGALGRHAEMPEDSLDHSRLFDERDQPQAAATPGASQNVKPEGARHQGCPRLAAGVARRSLRGASLTSLLAGRVLQPSSRPPRTAGAEPLRPARPPGVPARHGTKSS